MTKLAIAVVEDSDTDYSLFLEIIDRYEKSRGMDLDVVRFPSGEAFLFSEENYPIIILDIQLSGINGLDLARKIRQKDRLAVLIFVTSLAKYACEGYEVDAMDYVVKPVQYLPFSLKLDKAIRIAKEKNKKEMFLSTENGFRKIDVNDVLYIEVKGHSILFHLDKENIPTFGSLKDFEKKMSPYGFLRCNNCFLVNPLRVYNVQKYDCVLDTGETIAISHPKKKKFLDDLLSYVGKVNQ